MCIIALAGLAEVVLGQVLAFGYFGLFIVAVSGLVALKRRSFIFLSVFIILAIIHTFLFKPFRIWISPFYTVATTDTDLKFWNEKYNTFAWTWAIVLGLMVIIFAFKISRWKDEI